LQCAACVTVTGKVEGNLISRLSGRGVPEQRQFQQVNITLQREANGYKEQAKQVKLQRANKPLDSELEPASQLDYAEQRLE
jgi:hypothetical protein